MSTSSSVVCFDIAVPYIRNLLVKMEENREVNEFKREVADIVLKQLGVEKLTSDNLTPDFKQEMLINVSNMRIPTTTPVPEPPTTSDDHTEMLKGILGGLLQHRPSTTSTPSSSHEDLFGMNNMLGSLLGLSGSTTPQPRVSRTTTHSENSTSSTGLGSLINDPNIMGTIGGLFTPPRQ